MLASIVSAGLAFTCTATHVWDGDGPIWCAEGPKIRLEAIAAREIDETCKQGHPCPTASGAAARDNLVHLLGGARERSPHGHVLVGPVRLSCVSRGAGKGDRTAAHCSLPDGRDLSCEQVRAGVAIEWGKYGRACRR